MVQYPMRCSEHIFVWIPVYCRPLNHYDRNVILKINIFIPLSGANILKSLYCQLDLINRTIHNPLLPTLKIS